MEDIRIAVVGLGNCASALVQGIEYDRRGAGGAAGGLLHEEIGGYRPGDIRVVAALDVDRRKVGRPLGEALAAPPNCTRVFCPDAASGGVAVAMGRVLDGVAAHMTDGDPARGFRPASGPEPTAEAVADLLRRSGARILVNYLPVGAVAATGFYAECALAAGLGFVNAIPVFVASDPAWAGRFRRRGLPLVGDDIKSQVGATIVHRALARLFRQRGAALDRTYQLNTGGNTDFRNMLDRGRLAQKKTSKTEAVQSVLAARLEDDRIHVGPSDYVPWLRDNKVAYIRMEGRIFGGVPMDLELRLSVEDSPNSAGVAVDAIRCCQLALDRGLGGPLEAVCAAFMKHPPVAWDDETAHRMTDAFIAGAAEPAP